MKKDKEDSNLTRKKLKEKVEQLEADALRRKAAERGLNPAGSPQEVKAKLDIVP